MPSSPAEQALRQLTERYDQAFEALKRDDMARVEGILADTDALVAQLPDRLPDEAELRALHTRATESHGRLVAAMRELHGAIHDELGSVRRGRKALKGYGGPGLAPGRRVHSEG